MPRVIITVPDKNAQPYRFQLDRRIVSLGRGSDNDIVIESGSVSGKHAEMHRVEGGYELADIGSTNGIKCNGVREDVVKLQSGMTVKLGDVEFDFSLTEEELEILGLEKSPDTMPAPRKPGDCAPARLPKAEAPPRPAIRRQAPVARSSGGGFGMIFLFLLLAAGSFCIGLGVRYQKDTGESLIQGISDKGGTGKTVPAAEAPAGQE